MTLQAEFPLAIDILRQLFPPAEVDEHFHLLERIYFATEELWGQYLPAEVKYLLIAEAPPFRPIDPVDGVVYFYNQRAHSRTLLRALSAAFNAPAHQEDGTDQTLLYLKEKGFLLIDSLPFAMDYTRKRKNRKYKELVKVCVGSYLTKKLKNVRCSGDVKVAFAFKKNAEAVISACTNQHLPVLGIGVTEAQIAVNLANYTCSQKLREAFHLV